jgi:hypothetical protein
LKYSSVDLKRAGFSTSTLSVYCTSTSVILSTDSPLAPRLLCSHCPRKLYAEAPEPTHCSSFQRLNAADLLRRLLYLVSIIAVSMECFLDAIFTQ